MASALFISGPSKLSLLPEFDDNAEDIWLTFDLKFAIMSFRRFISLSVLSATISSIKEFQMMITRIDTLHYKGLSYNKNVQPTVRQTFYPNGDHVKYQLNELISWG